MVQVVNPVVQVQAQLTVGSGSARLFFKKILLFGNKHLKILKKCLHLYSYNYISCLRIIFWYRGIKANLVRLSLHTYI